MREKKGKRRGRGGRWLATVCAIGLWMSGCTPPALVPSSSVPPASPDAPSGPTEEQEPTAFQATWITYAELQALIGGKTPAEAAQAIERQMARLADKRVTAVFFHVRANSDAYYASACFSAAAWVQPLLNEGLDPLAVAVQSAHRHGMELHAWLNPFRIGRDVAAAHCADWMEHNGVYYYVPSSSAVQRLVLDGVRELLTQYEVDGIHFDDYFYPAGCVPPDTPAAFEQADFEAYREAGGAASVGDWRRLQVDCLVAATCRLAHRHGKRFGISPAARLAHCTDTLYADVAQWMRVGGYADYLCPQIYYGFQNQSMPFERVLNDWAALPRHSSVKLYVGLAVYKAGMRHDAYAGTGADEWGQNASLLARQVRLVKQHPQVDGVALYSSSYLDETTHPSLGSGGYDESTVRQELQALTEVLKE